MRESLSKMLNRVKGKKEKKKRAASLALQNHQPPVVTDIQKPRSESVLSRLTTDSPEESAASQSSQFRVAGAKKAGGSPNTKPPVNFPLPTHEGIADSPIVVNAYDDIPVLEETKLPRGGVSVETEAVGRVQFGIPPETIKDSMKLGLPVPQVYIVPVERFCREMGPALGVNLAEFEFPAYFNFFIKQKRCTLVVDSLDAEDNIRRVFSETLLGPEQFRRSQNPITHEPEDFSPNFPASAIPNFQKELEYFRIGPNGKELVLETLLNFCHFQSRSDGHDNLAVPPQCNDMEGMESLVHESASKFAALPLDDHDEDEDETLLEENDESVPVDESTVENREKSKPWSYSKAKFMGKRYIRACTALSHSGVTSTGEVATIWPLDASKEQIQARSVPRVEIFKMPSGTEYIIHDVDANNSIVGKARLSGHVKVSETLSVDGFGGHSILDDVPSHTKQQAEPVDPGLQPPSSDTSSFQAPPTFHPPSFGVTVLGNSSGFDAKGSVSGYVLWINGRGVMIDPPPYSSATLEREGIRPRTIVGIILTHCHADHDAGAFQKVLTGSPVVVITTPTIYKSFIRKYAALSALSPALLRHCHRFKPAVIGQPLRFQGATFHFTYTLHSIPCIGFRVEWRGRSMIFTGDHLNHPAKLATLCSSGVLSKARVDDLNNFPTQDADLLLHEAGVPPLHTPLEILLQLPDHVKKRLFVVHTAALPPDCELKVAPTGTKGTIRLDQMDSLFALERAQNSRSNASFTLGEDEYDNTWNGPNEYVSDERNPMMRHNIMGSFIERERVPVPIRNDQRTSMFSSPSARGATPLVALRPASSTDAWFILNLLSAVPFVSSLSYTSTMELLETARVDAFKKHDIVLQSARRNETLCVIWEGTAVEVVQPTFEDSNSYKKPTIWYAGDWTGPISLQPDRQLSGESKTSKTHDLVAVSNEGVKVITVEFSSLHCILKSGSVLYRKYLERKSYQERAKLDLSNSEQCSSTTQQLLDDALKDLNVLELLNCNSALRKLSAVQKRHLESLAEGPVSFQPNEKVWRAGSPVDKAFIIVSGSVSFSPRRRNAGSATVCSNVFKEGVEGDKHGIGATMQKDASIVVKELGRQCEPDSVSHSSSDDNAKSYTLSLEKVFNRDGKTDQMNQEYEELKKGLDKRHTMINSDGSVASTDFSLAGTDSQGDQSADSDDMYGDQAKFRTSARRRRSSKLRKANKVLGRLYNRRAFTGGFVFSRGHFLGDVSKMVADILSSDPSVQGIDEGPAYGFGDQVEGEDTFAGMVIPEEEGKQLATYTSTLTAGRDGCVVLVFPKATLGPFLDQYPGLLLSLLGTQVVV